MLKQLQENQSSTFHGGLHLHARKEHTSKLPIATVPLADEIILPIKQHVGQKSDICVKVGQHVLKGEALTQTSNIMALPVHASTSGVITAIKPHTIPHPSGLSDTCIFIKPDGQDTWYQHEKTQDYTTKTPFELIQKITQAGICGLGGAGFPTAVKVSAGQKRLKLLIINAVECEPYISADDRLIQEHAEEIMQGTAILKHILKPEAIVIALEEDTPAAISAIQAVCPHDVYVRVVPAKYPSGGEKQLIELLTGEHVPKQGLPIDKGILVQNVGTVFAIARALLHGEPLISRVVTITGDAFATQTNAWVPIGTPVSHILTHFQLTLSPNQRIIMGGPMMGYTLPHADIPISKTSNCLLAPTDAELPAAGNETECIRCSACADACPATLLPQQLYWFTKGNELGKAKAHDLFECIECGACAYVCPSEIPLVHYYRGAKSKIREKEREHDKAERAKERFEKRQIRLENEKQERMAKMKALQEQAKQKAQDQGTQSAVAAALARVRQKKQDAENANPTQTHDSNPQQQAVAAAIARAKAKKAAQDSQPEAPDTNSEDARKKAVAAAIARAKAKKAQQSSTDDE